MSSLATKLNALLRRCNGRKASMKKPIPWLRVWEVTLASLAIVELWSCLHWNQGHHIPKMTFVEHFDIYSAYSPSNSSKETLEVSYKNNHQSVQECTVAIPNEDIAESHSSSRWKVWLNWLFMAALLIQAMIDSWNRAHRFLPESRESRARMQRSLSSLYQTSRDGLFQHRRAVLVFCGVFFVHVFFLPMLSHRSEKISIAISGEERRLLHIVRSIFAQRKQAVCNFADSGYSSTAKIHTVLEALVLKLFKHAHEALSPALRANLKILKVYLSKRIAKLALMHPIRFRLRLTQAFRFIRWAKFLAPLVGACNKLLGNLLDFHSKRRLRQRRRRASRAWSVVLHSTISRKRGEIAAAVILENFRAKQLQKLAQETSEKEEREAQAVTMIQSRFRTRKSINDAEVKQLERQLCSLKRNSLTLQDRFDAMELKKEIRARSRANRKLLLRPNSAFSVTWKIIAISCVALEVAQSILAPQISGKMEKMDLREMLEAILLSPQGIASSTFFHFFLQKICVVVKTICFLDVFITFFTGELDKQTGVLVPKPFFKRWILPGAALQLIVNPAMSNVCDIVKQLLQLATNVGPTRVIRVMLALLPLAQILVDCTFDAAFFLVRKANRRVVPSMFLR